MRTADEIKKALIHLRFTKRLALANIAQDSRCSPYHVMLAMKCEASEIIQRRLDAYLDAKHLHVYDRKSDLLDQIERMTNELAREYQARSLPMKDVKLMSVDQQTRLRDAMDWRLKRLLRERIQKDYGIEIYFSDAERYWRCKAKVQVREGKLAPDRKSPYRYRPSSVGEGGDLLTRKNKNRKPPGVVDR